MCGVIFFLGSGETSQGHRNLQKSEISKIAEIRERPKDFHFQEGGLPYEGEVRKISFSGGLALVWVVFQEQVLTTLHTMPPFAHVWGKCKDLRRYTMFFCLGGIACMKLLENGSPVKLLHISDIPHFPLELNIENQSL